MPIPVVLIRPPLIIKKSVIGARPPALIPPAGIAYLAGFLRAKGFNVSVIDGFGEAPDTKNSFPDFDVVGLTLDQILARIPGNTLIGVSCMFSNDWPYVRQLLTRIKEVKPGSTLLLGGEHATAMPKYVFEDCPSLDYVIRGEGEKPLLQLAERITRGLSLENIPGLIYRTLEGISLLTSSPRITDLDSLPLPAWDMLPIENYLSRGISVIPRDHQRIMPLVTSRGCPYTCKFCSSLLMWGTRFITRSPEGVVEEIKSLVRRYAISGFDIIDLTFIVNKAWILRFCELLIQQNLHLTWYIPTTRSEAIDEEMAILLKKSGCTFVYLTPDSGSREQLAEMSKKIDLKKVKNVSRIILKQGIGVRINLVIAFPNERHKDIWKTIFYGMQLAWIGIFDIIFLRFTPYPGSEYFELCMQRGQIPVRGPKFDHFLISNVTGEWSEVHSYTPHVTSSSVKQYLLLATFLTQLVYLFRHPWNGIKALKRIVVNQPDTPLEHAFAAMLQRLNPFRRISPKRDC